MKIYSGSLELFESGVAQTAFEKNIVFDFGEISLELLFKRDKGRKENEDEFVLCEEKNGLILNLYNYDKDPSGYLVPVEIGVFEGRSLWFNFRARSAAPDVEAWVVDYFFYRGDEVGE